MKLAAKIVLLCLVAMVLMSGLFSYITIKRDAAHFADEHDRDALALARALQPLILEAWAAGGHAELSKRVNERGTEFSHIVIRYVRFDNHSIAEMQPAAPRDMLPSVVTKERLTITLSDSSGTHKLHTYVPVEVNDEGRLEVTRPMEIAHELARDTLWKSLMLLLTVAALCIGVVVIGGVRLIGNPLNLLVAKAKRIGTGDFTGPVELKGSTELSDLAGAMNEMCEQLELQRSTIESETESRLSAENQLRHADRLNTVGRLASGIAHEMGTPLNVVSGRAALIASGMLPDEDVKASAKTIKEEADRITKIIRGLLDFARRTKPARELANPMVVAQQTAELLANFADKTGVEVATQSKSDSYSINVDVGQLQQVLTNLVMNAVHATDTGGKVLIRVSKQKANPPADLGAANGDYVRIDVRDTGCGIREEDREHIFEPFFTTKDVGEGTGLGLAISYGIIRDHDGWIDVASEPGNGACFSVFLPAAL